MNTDFFLIVLRNNNYFILFSAIVGSVFFSKFKKSPLRVILYLLWFITIIESLIIYESNSESPFLMYYNKDNKLYYNYWIYNILDTISFLTYYYMFFHSLSNLNYKKWVKLFASTYIIASIFNWVFVQNFFTEMQSYLFILGAIFIIVSIIFYFIELLNSDKIIVFHRELLFWVSIGLLLYYAGNIPFAAEFNGYALIPGIHELFLIVNILSITMYLLFTFGFIWSKKEE